MQRAASFAMLYMWLLVAYFVMFDCKKLNIESGTLKLRENNGI